MRLENSNKQKEKYKNLVKLHNFHNFSIPVQCLHTKILCNSNVNKLYHIYQ